MSGFADNVLLVPAVHFVSAAIPRKDCAIEPAHDDGVMGKVQQSGLSLEGLFGAVALGDILDGEKDQRLLGAETAGVQNHDALAEALKFMAHFEVIDARFLLDDAVEQLAQSRDVP